jgi:glycosyltransferase involved in cell wall biosynthesis
VALTTEPAGNPNASAARAIRTIPDLHVRPTYFGPSIHGADRLTRLKRGLAGAGIAPSLLALAAYIRKHDIRVIHATEKPRDALYAVLLGKATGARSVIHMHVAYGEWMSRATLWALRNANGIVAISQFVADSLVEAGYPRQRIHIVPNALDLDTWGADTDGRPVRQELDLPRDAPVVGIISRLFRWKGHAYLIDAFASVKREVPAARLVIVGEDDPRAAWEVGGAFSEQLKQQAAHLGILNSIVFTGFRTDIARLIASFDVFAHPSWEEPFGMVFLEAMAMRKPVVAWNSGGAPEVIVHGETGLLAERGSVPALAQALVALLRDPDLRQRLGTAGRQRVERYFTADRMATGILDAYRATLSDAALHSDPAPGRPDSGRAA